MQSNKCQGFFCSHLSEPVLILKVSAFGNESEVQCSNGLLFGANNKNIKMNFDPFFPCRLHSNSGLLLSLLKLSRPKFYEKLGIPSYFVHVQWSCGLQRQGALAVICTCQCIPFYSLWLFCAARQVCALCTKLCPLDIIIVSKKHGGWDPDRLTMTTKQGILFWDLYRTIILHPLREVWFFPLQKMEKARFKARITLDTILSEEWSKAVKVQEAGKLKKACS